MARAASKPAGERTRLGEGCAHVGDPKPIASGGLKLRVRAAATYARARTSASRMDVCVRLRNSGVTEMWPE
jgi:hypothetical protein